MTMAAIFTARGTRWRVLPVDTETATKQHIPPLPGPGLLFTSSDAEIRFLPLESDAIPTEEYLREKSVDELAALVQLAKPLGP